jgi:pentatricopeptide repeat protein
LSDIFLLAWAKSEVPDAVDHALSILHTMEQKGLQPDVRMYSSVIDCIAQCGEKPEQAKDILDRMMKAGVHPNVVTYSAVINGKFGCLV